MFSLMRFYLDIIIDKMPDVRNVKFGEKDLEVGDGVMQLIRLLVY